MLYIGNNDFAIDALQYDFKIVNVGVPHISQSANNRFWKPEGALNIIR